MSSTYLTKADARLHALCGFFALGSFVWGYNIGVLSSILVHPGFVEVMSGELSPQRKGIITAIYYLGTWTSYIFLSRPASDILGRRYAALAGTLVVCIGSSIQAGASGPTSYSAMVIGRIVAGLGVAVVSTSVPLYQSEISPAKTRGKFVVVNHVGFIAGLAAGFWVGYAVTFWDSPHGIHNGWRFSLAIQFIPAFFFMAGLPFLPETPRWLVEHRRLDEGLSTLRWFREDLYSEAQLQAEYGEIRRNVYEYGTNGSTWLSLFKERHLFNRLWRATVLQFMAQICGATAMKYYLPTLLQGLGLSRRASLLAGGVESTLKIGMVTLEAVLIDRLGRRLSLIIGAAVMASAMLINGALPRAYPDNINRAADYTCVMFIFVYALGYSMGFGPSAWVYGSEIFPQSVRARGLNFAASGGSIGSIIAAQIWPVGISRIGPNMYFIFMALNIACVPVIYLFFPETKGLALEDMDHVFGKTSTAAARAEDLYDVLPQRLDEEDGEDQYAQSESTLRSRWRETRTFYA